MPTISVIIPVYNAEKYIEDCLNSVLNQTFSDFEVICVNDGSTDDSAFILGNFVKKDPRIKVLNQDNEGVISARNKAISHANGEYIYILDCDDIIDSSLFEKSIEAIKKHKGDIITCRVFLFGEGTNYEYRLFPPNKTNMSFTNCLVNSALFSKELFLRAGGYDITFKNGLEDYDLWLNMLFNQNASIYRIPEILFFYRIKKTFESRNKNCSMFYRKELLECLTKKYPQMRKNKQSFIRNILFLLYRIRSFLLNI